MGLINNRIFYKVIVTFISRNAINICSYQINFHYATLFLFFRSSQLRKVDQVSVMPKGCQRVRYLLSLTYEYILHNFISSIKEQNVYCLVLSLQYTTILLFASSSFPKLFRFHQKLSASRITTLTY